jgi:hypothetical protein
MTLPMLERLAALALCAVVIAPAAVAAQPDAATGIEPVIVRNPKSGRAARVAPPAARIRPSTRYPLTAAPACCRTAAMWLAAT